MPHASRSATFATALVLALLSTAPSQAVVVTLPLPPNPVTPTCVAPFTNPVLCPPALGDIGCQAYAVLLATPVGEQHLSRSRTFQAASGAPWTASFAPLDPPLVPHTHADAQVQGGQVSLAGVTVSVKTAYSQCDTIDPGDFEAYGRGGVLDLEVNANFLAGTLLHIKLGEFTANADTLPLPPLGAYMNCELAYVEVRSIPVLDVCPTPWAGLPAIQVTFNEQWGPVANPATGQSIYGGSAVHLRLLPALGVPVDLFVGYVTVAVPFTVGPPIPTQPTCPVALVCVI